MNHSQGIRKCGFLVNQGDKLTAIQKKEKIEENRKKYGLTQEQIDNIKLPYVKNLVEIYEIDKILNSKKNLSTVDKISHLEHLKEALENKLSMIKKGTKFSHHGKNQKSINQYQKSLTEEGREALSEVDEEGEEME